MNNQSHAGTNFQAVYKLQGAYINGKYWKRKHVDTVFRVASALAGGMCKKTLSPEVASKVNNIFHDFARYPFVQIARTRGPIYKQQCVIMTAEDAQEYKNVRVMEKNLNLGNWESQRVLSEIIKRSGNKNILVYADENNGNLTITDIERVEKKPEHKRN
jgi:hypothetical protein